MKTKSSRLKLLEDISDSFGEWHEMGYSLTPFLVSMLEKERDKNDYYERRIASLESQLNRQGAYNAAA